MEKSPANGRILHFGVFEVDARAGELRKSGLKIKLQEQPLQILTLLLEHPGEVVTREEIQRKLWPTDTFVDFEHSLNTAVTKLRQALGDDADNPRFIETLPRRGYRFVGAVNGKQEPLTAALPTLTLDEPPPIHARISRVWIVLSGVAAVALLLSIVAVTLGLWQKRQSSQPTMPQVESIAVLPLDNLSGNPAEEYFVDGMTDLLINDLSKISALRVISRTSVMQYKGARKPLPEIGRELNVDAIVEGAVLRSGNRVRITAQLIDAKTEKPLWAETYEHDLSDVLKIQAEVAQAIAGQVLIKMTPQERERLASTPPVDPEAQEDYFKGRYYEIKAGPLLAAPANDDLNQSLKYFQKAVVEDPHDGPAFAGMADSYVKAVDFTALTAQEGYSKAKAAALQALAIDDSLADAHVSLAEVLWLHEWDWAGADKEFKRAIELNRSNPVAHAWFARFLGELGRTDAALDEIEIARKLDPASLLVNTFRGVVLEDARKYDQAIDQFNKTLEMYPNASNARFWLMSCYEREGKYNESVAENLKNKEMTGTSREILAQLRDAYAKDGVRGWWRKELETAQAQGWANDCNFASLYALLGEKDHALDALEKAYEKRGEIDCPYLRSLKVSPIFDDYRADPRFQALERKIGLLH